MDYLIYLLHILPKEFGAVIIILKGGVTVSPAATACRGPHERRKHAPLRAIDFPINDGLSVLGGVLGKVFFRPQNVLFCYSLSLPSRERN